MIQQKGSSTATYVCNSSGFIVVSHQIVLEHVRGRGLMLAAMPAQIDIGSSTGDFQCTRASMVLAMQTVLEEPLRCLCCSPASADTLSADLPINMCDR
jgi:hypothetical protein